jgi:FlgD Ig-like domain
MIGDTATDESSGRLGNWLAITVVAGLILATAVAFAETERLKLVRSPILDTVVSKAFAPDCHCGTEVANITFRLRRRGLMSVEIVTTGGRPVRRLAAHVFNAGLVSLAWYGRGGAGQSAREGAYKVSVHLWTERRTILLPNVIRLDRTAPTVSFTVAPRTIVLGQRLRVTYRLSEAAHPLVYVDGALAVQGRWPYLHSSVDWFGRVGGRRVRYGEHQLTMRARDIAGNLSQATPPVAVIVRPQPRPASKRHRPPRHTGGSA